MILRLKILFLPFVILQFFHLQLAVSFSYSGNDETEYPLTDPPEYDLISDHLFDNTEYDLNSDLVIDEQEYDLNSESDLDETEYDLNNDLIVKEMEPESYEREYLKLLTQDLRVTKHKDTENDEQRNLNAKDDFYLEIYTAKIYKLQWKDCQLARKESLSSNSKFTPTCSESGSYTPIQCTVKYCFCVDADGRWRPNDDFLITKPPVCTTRQGSDAAGTTKETNLIIHETANVQMVIRTMTKYDYFIFVAVAGCVCSILVFITSIFLVYLHVKKRKAIKYKMVENQKLYHKAYEAAKAQQFAV